ncbi:uncharacterized protein LOC143930370 isoform X2 [Lithobates pipiens]
MHHLLLLLLLGTAYAQEPDYFENDVDELVDPSSQENYNDMPRDLEEADDMPKNIEEADDMPKDIEEADDMPKDIEEADDMPDDLEEADDMPHDLEEAELNDLELEMSHNTSLECDSESTCHYKLFTCGQDFRSAQSVCRRQRGNLCSVRNSCVNNQLRAFARRYNQKLAWIGVWKPSCGGYRNVNGKKLKYTNFGHRQRKCVGRWCVALNVANGQWISVRCWKKLPYICRI